MDTSELEIALATYWRLAPQASDSLKRVLRHDVDKVADEAVARAMARYGVESGESRARAAFVVPALRGARG